MAFPPSWPPRFPTNMRSLRFFATGSGSANFSDNAFMFAEQVGANPYTPLPLIHAGEIGTTVVVPSHAGTGNHPPDDPLPQIWSGTLRISSTGTLEFSFDGVHVHGVVMANESLTYRRRYESGICVRGVGAVFRVEAW